MKNRVIFALIFSFALIFTFKTNVNALEIKTINATQQNGVVTVNGTTETGMLAATVLVFDSTGTDIVAMKTVPVDNNSYSTTFALSEDTYVIKVADYDGGDYISKSISPVTTNSSTNTSLLKNNTNNPKTGDNIIFYVCLLVLSIIALISGTLYIRKNKLVKSK